MATEEMYDVIIVGGSYAGLSAAMALGRSLKNVLIIDSGKPCNVQTPHSHNFLTRDGETPANLAAIAKSQALAYPTVHFMNALASNAVKTDNGFAVFTADEQKFESKKMILATGVKDIFPPIIGFAACWGISVLHCPYCHGYEVRNKKTGIIANGEIGFEFSKLISNWTDELTLFTNGAAQLNSTEVEKLRSKNIHLVETEIEEVCHENGLVKSLRFKDGSTQALEAIYAKILTVQNTSISDDLNINLTDQGYIEVNAFKQTSVAGIYAAGDCTTLMRAIADAVAGGNLAGAMLNRELVAEGFE